MQAKRGRTPTLARSPAYNNINQNWATENSIEKTTSAQTVWNLEKTREFLIKNENSPRCFRADFPVSSSSSQHFPGYTRSRGSAKIFARSSSSSSRAAMDIYMPGRANNTYFLSEFHKSAHGIFLGLLYTAGHLIFRLFFLLTGRREEELLRGASVSRRGEAPLLRYFRGNFAFPVYYIYREKGGILFLSPWIGRIRIMHRYIIPDRGLWLIREGEAVRGCVLFVLIVVWWSRKEGFFF